MNIVSGAKKLPALAIPIPDWPEEDDDDAYGFPQSCPPLNSNNYNANKDMASAPQYSVWCPPVASPACTRSPLSAADSRHPKAEADERRGSAQTVETGGGVESSAEVPRQPGQQRKLRGKPEIRRLSQGTTLQDDSDTLPWVGEHGNQRMLTPTPSHDRSKSVDSAPLPSMISPATSSEVELKFQTEACEGGLPEESSSCNAEASVRNRRKVWRRISLSPHAVSGMHEARLQEDSKHGVEQPADG